MNSLLFGFLAATVASSVYQNIDNFALAAAYRMRGVTISGAANRMIAILSGLASGAAVVVGCRVAESTQDSLGDALKMLSSGLLIMLGVWIVVGYFRNALFPHLRRKRSPEEALPVKGEVAAPRALPPREAMVVALALAADNLAPSFLGALSGAMGQNPVLAGTIVAILTGGLSLLAIRQGQALGKLGGPRLRFIAPELASASLVIGIALLGLVESSNPLNPERWFGRIPPLASNEAR